MRISGLGAPQILPSSTVSTIASTIQQVEGYIPPNAQYPNGTLAYQNNNPGNLRYVGQAGAVPGAGGFAKFPSYDAGVAALQNQIQIYAGQGLTIQQMMNIYAPSSDGNDPNSYANTIASTLGVSPDTPLQSLTDDQLAALTPDVSDADTSSIDSIDLTDPTTLTVIGGIALLGIYFLRR